MSTNAKSHVTYHTNWCWSFINAFMLFYCSWRCLAERKPLQNMTSSVFRERQHCYNYTIPNYLWKRSFESHATSLQLFNKVVLWWCHPSIRPGKGPECQDLLALCSFSAAQPAGRIPESIKREKSSKKSTQKWGNRWQQATSVWRGFRPWELLFFSKSEKTWSCKASVAKAAATWLRWSTVGWDQVFCKAWHKGCNKFRQDMAATQRWDEWRTVNRCG